MILLNRNRSGPDKHLEWKVRLFLLGAALAMGGIGFDSSILIWLATLVLLAGVGLRFLPRGEDADADVDGDAEFGPPNDADHGARDPDAEDSDASDDGRGL